MADDPNDELLDRIRERFDGLLNPRPEHTIAYAILNALQDATRVSYTEAQYSAAVEALQQFPFLRPPLPVADQSLREMAYALLDPVRLVMAEWSPKDDGRLCCKECARDLVKGHADRCTHGAWVLLVQQVAVRILTELKPVTA